MKTFILFLFFSISGLSSLFAQEPGKISGKINKNEKGLPGATVTLLRVRDTATVKLSVTNKEGIYSFEYIPQGKYILMVSAVGHKKARSPIFELTPAAFDVELAAISLTALPQTMSGVTVTATRPLVEQKIDRMVVNVDASVTNIGTSALEVLEKSPGITVDRDGNISLKGKEGVIVTIDGRPTQLGGADLANLLRSMNSNQLDQIEIMTNPPARYDAAGNAGIINLKTKKNTTAGYNGLLSLGYVQGRYPKTNEAFNFNYKAGKVNLFTNLSHNYRKSFEVLTIQRNILDNWNQLRYIFDQRGDKIVHGNSCNAKVGMDYFASKKTTLGVVMNVMSSPSSVTNNNKTSIYNPSKILDSTTYARVDNISKWKNYSGNINMKTLLDKKGKELSADLDLMKYDATNRQFMENAYQDAVGNDLQKADTLLGLLPQEIQVYSARMDYVRPINKTTKFEAGLKSSIVNTDNDANYDSIQYGRIVHDFNRSNHFVYRENINAAYVTLSTAVSKKINAQLGLRLENTNANGKQLTTGEEFDRDYTSLFPTAYFQYKANKKNNFGMNYGRRIRRPDYSSLNPFIRFIDRYTYSQGNPNLKPQFSDNIEFTHTYNNFLTTTLNYTATNDIIQSVIEQKGQEAYQTAQNIASLRQVGLSMNLNKQMNKKWTNNLNLNLFHNRYNGIVNNALIDFENLGFMASTTQQVKVNKRLTAELNGKYRGKWLSGVLMTKPLGTLAVGLSQQVWKTRGTFRLTFRDVFYSQKMRATIKYGNVDAAFQEVGDSRQLALGFSYRFNKGKTGPQRKRTTSAGEEQERIGIEN